MGSRSPAIIAGDLDPTIVVVEFEDSGYETHAPLGIRLAQALYHGSDHRSQVCTVLTTLGIEPPGIEVWDFAARDGPHVHDRIDRNARSLLPLEPPARRRASDAQRQGRTRPPQQRVASCGAAFGDERRAREIVVFLFRRKKKDEEPVDMEARSPESGLKYKDIALLGQMMKQGADLNLPRHALYYLYFSTAESAEAGAIDARAAAYSCEVREPRPAYPGQWALVCERHDAVLDIAGARGADDLFQEIADRHAGEFDGWEAAV